MSSAPPPDPDNAFVERRTLAGADGGALSGTTFAVKDNIAVAGMAFTAGHPLYRDRKAETTAPAVQRLLAAGATCIGVTSTDAGGFGATTPQTVNPAFAGHVVGGSSGGSAAAVARGLCDFAVGTDTGGSVRIPAACTGLAAFKPTFGRVPNDGVWPLAPTLDHVGLIGADIGLMQRAGQALLGIGSPVAADDVARLRIGIEEDSGGFLEPSVAASVDYAVRLLARAGHDIVRLKGPDRRRVAAAHGTLVLSEAARVYAECSAAETDRLGEAARQALRHADTVSAAMVSDALETLEKVRAWAADTTAAVDVWISPTLPVPPPRAGERRIRFAGRDRPPVIALTFLTCLANLVGSPTVALPLRVPDFDLPFSLQLTGGRGRDEVLLSIAAQLTPIFAGNTK